MTESKTIDFSRYEKFVDGVTSDASRDFALDTMRMESGFLHWGHDISPEENQYQAGLNFTISYKKDINFIGKEALLKIKDQKVDRRFAMFTLKDNKRMC